MNICAARFNLVLATVLALLGGGCESLQAKKKVLLGLHMEINNPDRMSIGQSVSVGRNQLMTLMVEKSPFLDERFVAKASVVKSPGGFSITLQFDRRGTWLLQEYSTTGLGRRVAVYSHFDEQSRWLAAPMLTQTITDGVLTFTPDTTAEDAEAFVNGLNRVAKEHQKYNP